MKSIIEENMQYPKSARKDRVGGRVVVQFVIDTTGDVADIRTVESVREDIDQEAMRLISLLKGWTPGTMDGKKVRVQYQLPLNFYPDNKWKKAYQEAKAREGIAH
ncbi:MAG: energy transducer TonB [Haliscomenobacter sp.]|nr:energy transducer TonB [Haliscomenobacter sp.]MBK7477499.1 energy transducer TonB [Haliscomenobacter sp.]MBK8878988.1 energy transducer TonB [Haliscomenobacter sp.]